MTKPTVHTMYTTKKSLTSFAIIVRIIIINLPRDLEIDKYCNNESAEKSPAIDRTMVEPV